MSLAAALAAAALTTAEGAPAASAPAPSPAANADSVEAEFAAAIANMARVKALPKLLDVLRPALPEAERVLGHHGTVEVRALLGEDGQVHRARVVSSSGAPGLDALAVSAVEAYRFEPARDGRGRPLTTPINMQIEFYAYRTQAPGGGLQAYGCRQFVLDMDWWAQTHPADQPSKLYNVYLGLGALVRRSDGTLVRAAEPEARRADFSRRWDQALEACRVHPERRLNDVLMPEGPMADALGPG